MKNNNLDDSFYLNEISSEPKEIFKFIYSSVGLPVQGISSWLDIGCGTGSFLSYLYFKNSSLRLLGCDKSQAHISRALMQSSSIDFFQCDFITHDLCRIRPSVNSVVSMIGLTGIFRSPDEYFPRLIESLSGNFKYLVIADLMNPYPVDVHVRARKVGLSDFDETYFNLHSIDSLKNIARSLHFSTKFYKFPMPFDLPQQDDPFRSWTVKFSTDQRMLTNGLGQLYDIYVCVLSRL